MPRSLCLPLLLVPFLSTSTAQDPPQAEPRASVETTAAPRDVAELLRPIRERHVLPCLGGAIVTTEGVTALGVVGVRERGRPEEATPADLFHIGSCTKAMTATLAGVLVERGKLAWDATVGELFADLGQGLDAGWKDVTLEDLLAHQGGGPANLVDHAPLGLRVWEHEGRLAEQQRVLLEGVLAKPPAYAPGTKFVYSNDGYAIAGAMIERAARTTWREAIQGLLFEPLGMASAGFGPPGEDGAHDQPVGHRASGEPVGRVRGSDNPEVYDPAGRVHCTLADWGRFVALHLSEQGAEGVVGAETLARLHAGHPVAEPPYAMGWVLVERPWGGGTVLTHNGSNTNWFCVVWAAPERGFAVLAATNRGGDAAAQACDEVASALIQEHLLAQASAAAGSHR